VNDFVLALIIVVAVPGYMYLLVRWIVAAAVRSYFEVKQEFSKSNKEVV
jgi:hypothetical protein